MKAIIIVVAVALVGVAGYFLVMPQIEAPERIQEQAQSEEKMMEEKGKTMGVTDWIAAAVIGKKLECRYRYEYERGMPQEVMMHVDGKRYRMEYESAGAKIVTVFDGDTSYTWTVGSKQGNKMAVSCLDEVKSDLPEGQQDQYYGSSEDVMKNVPNIICQEIDAVDISVPTDVQFVDQCEMFKQSMQMVEQFKGQIPEDVQKMMRQQQGQQQR